MVEQRTFNAWVLGSIPSELTSRSPLLPFHAYNNPTLVDVRAIVQLQDERTRLWHSATPQLGQDEASESLEALAEALHAANFTLWHAEDEARLPSAGDAAIAAVKRQIDRVNQVRNDTAEQIDACLLASLCGWA